MKFLSLSCNFARNIQLSEHLNRWYGNIDNVCNQQTIVNCKRAFSICHTLAFSLSLSLSIALALSLSLSLSHFPLQLAKQSQMLLLVVHLCLRQVEQSSISDSLNQTPIKIFSCTILLGNKFGVQR